MKRNWIDIQALENRVVDALTASDTPRTSQQLAMMLGVKHSFVQIAVCQLVIADRIHERERAGNGKPAYRAGPAGMEANHERQRDYA